MTTVLRFPTDAPVGEVTAIGLQSGERKEPVPAVGEVEVPEGFGAMLQLDVDAARRPEVLAALPAADIVGLVLDEFDDAAAAAAVSAVPGIQQLVLRGGALTDAGFAAVCAAGIDLEQLQLDLAELTDASPASSCKNLQVLMFRAPKLVAVPEVQPSVVVGYDLGALESLNPVLGPATTAVLAYKAPSLTDEGVTGLAECRTITHVALASPQLTDEVLFALEGASALTSLRLPGKGITGRGVAALAGSSALTELSLTGAVLDAEALALLRALPALRKLAVAGIVGDIGALAGFPALRDVTVSGATEDEVLALRQACPEATVNEVFLAPAAVAKLMAARNQA